MSQALLQKYTQERAECAALIDTTLGRVDAEERDLVEAEIQALEDAKQRMTELDTQIGSIKDVMDKRNSALDVQHLLAKAEPKREVAQFRINEPAPSLGDAFTGSDEYRAWDGRGGSSRFTMESRATAALTRAPLQEGAAPGSLLMPTTMKHVMGQPERLTPLMDVIGKLQVSHNSIDMVTYGTPSGATGAATVAELAAKPEATIAATSTTVNVETVAYWIQASRQLLQDAPAARGLIDDQLRRGLVTTLEANISTVISGGTYAKTTGAAGKPLIEVARQGVATLQSVGYTPNALLCSPLDAAAFDIALLNAHSAAGAVFGGSVWGLRIVPVPGLTKRFLGDFSTGITLLERTGIEVFISDSHADTFTHNIFTILAEIRAKAVITQAAAITELVTA